MSQHNGHSGAHGAGHAAHGHAANGHANGHDHPSGPALLATPEQLAALNAQAASWSVAQTLSGKHILVTGTTGFLGKVYAAMLLHYHPDIAQMYLLIRARRGQTAEQRFYQQIAPSEPFEPLRQTYGPAFGDFLHEKITVVAGDVGEDHLGMASVEQAQELSQKLDLVVNSAGLTNFNPSLEEALSINTLAQARMLAFVRLGGCRASLMHVSTAFVAGRTQRPSPEVFPGPTIYPRFEELGVEYDAQREIADCQRLIHHVRDLSRDQEHESMLLEEARKWLRDRNRSPKDPHALDLAMGKVRARWVERQLSQQGRKRAAHWGWPNIYTYTKSLGERLLAEASGEVNVAIVRPAIIESAQSFPCPGWNEGINTTAPICFMMYKGHRFVPTRPGLNLDVIPVDHVSGAMIGVSAALIARRQHDVYHLGSSDLNPISVARTVELSTLGNRKLVDREVRTPGWKKLVLKNLDSMAVDQDTFERFSAPGIHKAATGLKRLVNALPTRSMGAVGKALETVKGTLSAAEAMTQTTEKIFELFMPFIHDSKLTFLSRNIKALAADLPPGERERYGNPIDKLDWRQYWLEVHLPGLYRHAFPELERKLGESTKESYTYEDLLELFEASTTNFAPRIALQHHDRGITERYTYHQLKLMAEEAARRLTDRGVVAASPVLLVSENRPQWGMAYFGILKAQGIGVPVDPNASAAQIANVAISCAARHIVLSEDRLTNLGPEIAELLAAQGHAAQLIGFGELFGTSDRPLLGGESEGSTALMHAPMAALVRAREAGHPVASLIYTSGTTGNPKGVMLTHHNFTSLLTGLQKTFHIGPRDGFLSVLPLHHTFEFACGFLVPMSRGASITYLEELSSEELSAALRSTRITSLIGVPALWQLLYRRIDQRISDGPPVARWLFDNLIELNTTLRRRLGINVGPMVFGPVHGAFGGRIKQMISGGAALPVNVLKAFYGLGFDMYEGYGLTEASPVLTVNRPSDGFHPGFVGKPIPGVTIDIKDPNSEGVGEVIARGANVMLGYLGREAESAKALEGGWLHTGDLGRLHKGRLEIVGREKELIVTSGGKNVYPDELEDIYGKCPHVLELSVVGLPDGKGSERVACLVRADLVAQATLEQIAEVRAAIREWIRVEGARVAPHNRIQVMRFWDENFPRTATRKVKRKEVVAILERLIAAEEQLALDGEVPDGTWAWLDKALGKLADYDAAKIHDGTHLMDELGFDSLMFVELASVLEGRGYHLSADRLATIGTVGELQQALEGGTGGALARAVVPTAMDRVRELRVPRPLAEMTKQALYSAQMEAYGRLFDVEVRGRAHIPRHNPNIVVVANHASHLDMGLVKYALGEFGADIRALAAADYFFSNTARKTYFKNFTNLLPIERSGSLEGSLGAAVKALESGEMLLIFPEGTRSTDGKLKPFRKGLGYLVEQCRVDILPLYIEGTYRALPKGRRLPNPASRKLKVTIGPLLGASSLLAGCQAMSSTERYQFISNAAHDAIAALRDGPPVSHGKAGGDLTALFDTLNAKFAQNQVDSPVSYYFSLGNHDLQKWTVVVDPTCCRVQPGKPAGEADCVVKTTPEIFRRMIQESYVPSMDEFMSGVIKTSNPDLLMRFGAVFNL